MRTEKAAQDNKQSRPSVTAFDPWEAKFSSHFRPSSGEKAGVMKPAGETTAA
jgi:hypothetical protein